MASITEAQGAVHYGGQVVFDWTRVNRHKKLAASLKMVQPLRSTIFNTLKTTTKL